MSKKNKADSAQQNKDEFAEQTFLSHLVELRDRLLRSVAVVAVLLLGLFPFADKLFSVLTKPVLPYLPKGATLIATGPISPFWIPFKSTLVAAIFLAMPYLLYQLWAFVAPGLYQHEKRLARPLLFSSIFLFYMGMVFAYFVVFPLVFGFISTTIPEGVTHTPDISQYWDFSLKLFFAFGVAFEVPIATIVLIATGMTSRQSLAAKRPYIIVAAFIIGMLLTPPDVISQTLLAVPMWLLFELGLIMSGVLLKKKDEQDEQTIAPPSATAAGAATASSTTATASTEDEEEWYEEHNPYYEDDEFVELSEDEMDDELDKAIAEEERLQIQSEEKDKDEDKDEEAPDKKPE